MHIKIIMAVFNPNRDYLDEQIKSIAEQTHAELSLIAVDADGKSSTIITEIAEKYGIAHDIVRSHAVPLNSYAAFELGCKELLNSHPGEEFLVAFSDQDDIWEPTKLAELSSALKDGVFLVHSDASLIDKNGVELSSSMFDKEKRIRNSQTGSLLFVNNVTGMTILCRKVVIEAAMPFPRQAALYFHHDLWLVLVATILGRVALIEKSLVRYRQHDLNVVGALMGKRPRKSRNMKGLARDALNSYYVSAYLAKMLYLRAEELSSEGTEINKQSLQDLRPFLSGGGHVKFALDALRIFPASRPTAYQAALRWIGATARQYLIQKRRISAIQGHHEAIVDKERFMIVPGVTPAYTRASKKDEKASVTPVDSSKYVDRRRVAKWESDISEKYPIHVNLLIPSLNPSEMFAGLATAVEVGIEMAEAGARVRFITTDAPIASNKASLDFIEKRVSDRAIMKKLSIEDGTSGLEIHFNPQDRFVATAWWTAHIAEKLLKSCQFKFDKFVYLIQDYEPNFYAWGDNYAAAKQSYGMNFIPLFNSQPLANYMKLIGSLKDIDTNLVFRPNINIDRYSTVPRQPHSGNVVAIYGRPEVERNMFPLAIAALNDFIDRNVEEIEDFNFISIGMSHAPVNLNAGKQLKAIGKIPWDDYPEFLGSIDIGLALMYSPHPSHLPIEMAAAGIVTVTNEFEGKDLSELTPYIISCDATTEAVSNALNIAWRKSQEVRNSTEPRIIEIEILGGTLEHAAREAFRHLQLPADL
ncbi:glycosyltransferase [Paracoccus aestuariivivens]|uniref:Glycosyltransferase n=1 Tax=Paracoccus aestuariivivens TaxID=1820333 RepID=A0A6L6JG75_9RHOB|nr:glycosyltransferase [Paracoccus aestuariivivens]MTH80285.1 glycosyltransferase [Paracoccus aestuariivivens]